MLMVTRSQNDCALCSPIKIRTLYAEIGIGLDRGTVLGRDVEYSSEALP